MGGYLCEGKSIRGEGHLKRRAFFLCCISFVISFVVFVDRCS